MTYPGTAYAQLRDAPTALRWLSQAAATGFPCYPWYERDPLLNPIRHDPRFIRFVHGLRRSWEDARAKCGNESRTPIRRSRGLDAGRRRRLRYVSKVDAIEG